MEYEIKILQFRGEEVAVCVKCFLCKSKDSRKDCVVVHMSAILVHSDRDLGAEIRDSLMSELSWFIK